MQQGMRRPGGQRAGGRYDYRGRDFAHFSPAERETWSHGVWHHEWHNGHYGWWWGVGGFWYFYPAPLYPYPDYVADVAYDDTTYAPDEYASQPAPVAGQFYYYYCDALGAYYPYVPSCPSGWRTIPIAPMQ